ncbi:MAG: hypothetical protein EYC70_07035 [Planctomycetota bacterium]|nr:MAG: hypothetical protein EYC70_07035 [Planctomycetota bacterium]
MDLHVKELSAAIQAGIGEAYNAAHMGDSLRNLEDALTVLALLKASEAKLPAGQDEERWRQSFQVDAHRIARRLDQRVRVKDPVPAA